MKPNYKEGDLIRVSRSDSFTLCRVQHSRPPAVRECPVQELEVKTYPQNNYEDIFENLEGKIGLIVYVAKNRLDQPLGYRVLIEGHEVPRR